MTILRRPQDDRFWEKVEMIQFHPCWEWTAARQAGGYGTFQYAGKGGDWRKTVAHRVAWELANGPIPNGLCVLHRCDNPGCVRPGHLFLGSLAENNRDTARKGRTRNQQKTHCKHGHLFSTENTYRKPGGGRSCRACHALYERGWRRRQ